MEGDWAPWTNKVPKIEVETHKVGSPEVVVPTLDTVRHESLLYTWLQEHKPMVLCGPPGSGKTMTLFSALRSLHDYEASIHNYSSFIFSLISLLVLNSVVYWMFLLLCMKILLS